MEHRRWGSRRKATALPGTRATAANRWQHFEPTGGFNLNLTAQGFYPLLIQPIEPINMPELPEVEMARRYLEAASLCQSTSPDPFIMSIWFEPSVSL